MYYKRRSGNPILRVIILGMIAGMAYLIYDNFSVPAPARPSPSAIQPSSGEINGANPEPIANSAEPQAGENAAPRVTDLQPDIPPGTTLFIPSAGIYANIFRVYLDGESWDVSRLGTNVGHLQGTSWLNEKGNVVLSGHVELSDGRIGAFANLDEIKIGDLVIVQQNGVEYRYAVTQVGKTTPDDLTPLYPSEQSMLTLITCGSYDFFSDSYLERTVVIAELLS